MTLIWLILLSPFLWAAWRMGRSGKRQFPAVIISLAVIGFAVYGIMHRHPSSLQQLVHDCDEAAGRKMGALLLDDLGPKAKGDVLLIQQYGLPSVSPEQRRRQRRGVEAALHGTGLRVKVTGPDWSQLSREEFDAKAEEDFTAEEFEALMKPFEPAAVISFCGFPPQSDIPADWPPFYVVQPDSMFDLRGRVEEGAVRALAIPHPNWHPARVRSSGRSMPDLFGDRYELVRAGTQE